jgi:hypothetical protein
VGRNSGVPYNEINAEQWRDIPGWQGYQVSDLGRVRHWNSDSWWMLKQNKQGGHKVFVVLSIHSKKWTVMVDRLVMEAFVGARKGRWIIHTNHNTKDNTLDNMQYATRKEYIQWFRDHQIAIGKTKGAEHRAAVVQRREQHIQRNNEAARKWLAGELILKDAAASIGISESALSYWIKRHGLKEEYANA